MPTIGLCMIVKNEAKLIRRCLDSCRPLIDYVCISDTGSIDMTPELIQNWLAEQDIPGVVVDHSWRDFATNRNLALKEIKREKSVDYVFMIDADDTIEIAPDFDIAKFKAGMNKDVYDLLVAHGSMIHGRPQIFRNNYPKCRWLGVLHEFLHVDLPFERETAFGLKINASIEGSRNADPQKFEKDAELLEKALKTEKDPYMRARYTFYLAQSYWDSRQHVKSLENYIACSKMGQWNEQVYYSLLKCIQCCTIIDQKGKFDEACGYFREAVRVFPSRAEAHHNMAFYCRSLGKNEQGMEIAKLGLRIPMPRGGLFIEPWIYDYGLLDEYSVNAYWCGRYVEALESALDIVCNRKPPDDQIKRVVQNISAAWGKIKLQLQAPQFQAPSIYSD